MLTFLPPPAVPQLQLTSQLKSPNASDRVWACAAICNLIADDAAMRRLFQGRNVIGALIERLSDDIDDVVVEASGTLRWVAQLPFTSIHANDSNLAIDGGHEICGEMFNKGIMPHLTVLMGNVSP